MQRNGNFYIFSFAIAVSVFASVLLALASTALKPQKAIAIKLDVIKNILSIAGYADEDIAAKKPEEILANYKEKFNLILLDKNNQFVDPKVLENELKTIGFSEETFKDLYTFELVDLFNKKISFLAKRAGKTIKEYDPGYKFLFTYTPDALRSDEGASEKSVEAYIVPIEGNGLWGMMYGYIALKPDLNTVSGIRFYKHVETPGLGGEAEKPWFTSGFIGKKILDASGSLKSVTVFKGKANEKFSGEELDHYVDGISGATITSKSITKFLKDSLAKYEPYFQTLRKAEQDSAVGQDQAKENK